MANLKLLRGIEIDSDYEHSIDFDNIAQQEAYFSSKAYYTSDKFLQIKDTTSSIFKTFLIQQTASVLRCEIAVEEARKCNYLMFKNDNDTKWYYAFIKQCYYINEAVTIIEYEIDVLQTFLFDFSIHNAFIEREHQDRWRKVGTKYNPIYNILSENINIGDEMVINDYKRLCAYTDARFTFVWCCFLFTRKEFRDDSIFYKLDDNAKIDKFMGNESLYACFVPLVLGADRSQNTNLQFSFNNTLTSIFNANYFLRYFCTCPDMVSCQILPYLPNNDDLQVYYEYDEENEIYLFHINTDNYIVRTASTNEMPSLGYLESKNQGTTSLDSVLGTINDDMYQKEMAPSINDIPSIDYESKLNTYPYKFSQIVASNDNIDIKNENLSNGGGNIKGRLSYYGFVVNQVYVENYLGDYTNNYNCLIDRTINELPIKTDAYINYLYTQHAQAQTQSAIGVGKGVITGIGGATLAAHLMGSTSVAGVVGGIVSLGLGAMSILDSVGSKIAMEDDLRTTPQKLERYGNDGTFGLQSKTIVPTIYNLEIKTQYKNICYNFFRLYGYKTNRFINSQNDANLRSRYYYNYIKTTNVGVDLPYSKDYHDKLVQIFNKGITLWHYRTGMGNNFYMFNYDKENWEVNLLQ